MRMQIFVILLTSLLTLDIGLSQDIRITYQLPDQLTVCSQDTFWVDLENTSNQNLSAILVQVSLPKGVFYQAGSIINASEQNVSDLSSPVFLVSQVQGFTKVKLHVLLTATCESYTQINQGLSFQNKIVIQYNGQQDSTLTNPPYQIQTPFLVITDVPDQIINIGTNGKRTVKITNTRLGSCREFIFEDRHVKAVISAPGKQILVENDTLLRIFFGPKDIVLIGDKDSLFEKDEMIVFEESIKPIDCNPYSIISYFMASWGCHQEYCQEYLESAGVEFVTNDKRAMLNFIPNAKAPKCICQIFGEEQELIVKNIGQKIAEQVIIEVRSAPPGSTTNAGIIKDSITVIGNVIIDSIIYSERNTSPICSNQEYYYSAKVYLHELDVNQEVIIKFRYATCEGTAPSGPNGKLNWYYSYNYSSQCVINSQVAKANIPVDVNLPILGEVKISGQIENNQSVLYSDTKYTFISSMNIPKGLTNEKLIVEFQLPCPLQLQDSLFLIEGKSPIEINIIHPTPGSSTAIKLIYQTPFNSQDLKLSFDIKADCSLPCIDSINNLQKIKFVSTCNPKLNKAKNILAEICSAVQLTCPDDLGNCGKSNLSKYGISFECDTVNTINDTVSGYLNFTSAAYRFNYGKKDNDNDRFRETGNVDSTLIFKNHVITGDTVANELFSKIVVDQKGASFDSLLFYVSTEVTMDRKHALIDLYDASEQKWFHFETDSIDVLDSKSKLPGCDQPVVTDLAIGSGYYVSLTPEMLHQLNKDLPAHFRFEENDSLHIIILGRIISFVGDRIAPINMIHHVLLMNRERVKENPFYCNVITHKLRLTTMNLQFDAVSNDAVLCGNLGVLPAISFKGSKWLNNFFPYEFRSFYKLDSALISISPGLRIDSAEINIFYFDSTAKRQVGTFIVPTYFDNRWKLDLNVLKQIRFDENYELQMLCYVSTDDCELIKDKKNLSANVIIYVSTDFDAQFALVPIFTQLYGSHIYTKSFTINSYNGNAYLDFVNKSLVTSDKNIEWKANLIKLQETGYFKIKIKSIKGEIYQFGLKTIPTVSVQKLDSSTFLVGPVPINTNLEFVFSAINSTCKMDTIVLESSWYCGAIVDTSMKSCTVNQFIIPVQSERAELEFDIMQNSKESVLCDTLPAIELYLYNADKGTAYNVYVDLFIPDGIIIDVNSIRVAYPSNAAFIPMAAPVLISKGHYRWNLAALVPSISANGLPGVEHAPDNGVRIKFQGITDCNSIVNGTIQFKTSAFNICGEMTNELSKNSQQIKIKGITTQGDYKLETILDNHSVCEDELDIIVRIIGSQISKVTDSFRIILPNPIQVINGSLKVISNIDISGYRIIQSNNSSELIVPMVDGIMPNQVISFSFRLRNFKFLECGEVNIPSIMYSRQSVFCKSSQTNCDVYVEGARANILFNKVAPSLFLDSMNITSLPLLDSTTIQINYHIANMKTSVDSSFCMGIYNDSNHNAHLDSNDPLINIYEFKYGTDVREGNNDWLVRLANSSIKQCALIAAIIPKSCLCGLDTLYKSLNMPLNFYYSDSLCNGGGFQIGVPSETNHTYRWIKGNVFCDTCSSNMVMFHDTNQVTKIFEYSLSDTQSDSCNRLYHYSILIHPNPVGKKFMVESCKNSSLDITSGDRVTFNWRGPGIVIPNQSVQKVVADTNKMYFLDFLDVNQCSGTDTFCVIVYPISQSGIISDDTTIVYGSYADLFVQGVQQIKWSPINSLDCGTCKTVRASPKETTTYEVMGEDTFGCPILLRVTVFVIVPECDYTKVFIPNAFSPNGDHANDVLKVYGINTNKIHLVIYDRWGEKVFESFSTDDGWNGMYKGKYLAPDVYGYYLEADCFGKMEFVKKGNISLLK
ncbi:MAG: gliding motility-associated C-terminal domain-containing protein [Saprospiraceae bacterium]|nr:gliding motility-associated C-terminal domain-containing protein [Candidatus Defluviibacterium haderslevense]